MVPEATCSSGYSPFKSLHPITKFSPTTLEATLLRLNSRQPLPSHLKPWLILSRRKPSSCRLVCDFNGGELLTLICQPKISMGDCSGWKSGLCRKSPWRFRITVPLLFFSSLSIHSFKFSDCDCHSFFYVLRMRLSSPPDSSHVDRRFEGSS
jgi:hypothetical protein